MGAQQNPASPQPAQAYASFFQAVCALPLDALGKIILPLANSSVEADFNVAASVLDPLWATGGFAFPGDYGASDVPTSHMYLGVQAFSTAMCQGLSVSDATLPKATGGYVHSAHPSCAAVCHDLHAVKHCDRGLEVPHGRAQGHVPEPLGEWPSDRRVCTNHAPQSRCDMHPLDGAPCILHGHVRTPLMAHHAYRYCKAMHAPASRLEFSTALRSG